VRWRAKATLPPNEPLEDFWQGSPPSIDFAECTATKLAVLPSGAGAVGPYSITLLGLQVAREDIAIYGPPSGAQAETQSPIATETKSALAVKIDANMEFLKDRYATMKKAGEGYLKGSRERSKPTITGKLHRQLGTAARTDAKLKVWERRYIEQKMNEHEVW
jgi:hypothetical protein